MNISDSAVSNLSAFLSNLALWLFVYSVAGPKNVLILLALACIGYIVLFLRALRS